MNPENFAFRCGWCGAPCDEHGMPMYDEAPRTDGETRHVHGWCCPDGDEDTDQRIQVTREMALDAGSPEMEGWWI